MASLHTHTHFTNSPCTSYMQTCTSSPKQSEPPMHCKVVIMNTELRGIKTRQNWLSRPADAWSRTQCLHSLISPPSFLRSVGRQHSHQAPDWRRFSMITTNRVAVTFTTMSNAPKRGSLVFTIHRRISQYWGSQPPDQPWVTWSMSVASVAWCWQAESGVYYWFVPRGESFTKYQIVWVWPNTLPG